MTTKRELVREMYSIEKNLGELRWKDTHTNEHLIYVLHEVAKALKRTPTCRDLKKPYPHYTTYTRRFGSWKEALKRAGFLQ